jgi:hypothetical protein
LNCLWIPELSFLLHTKIMECMTKIVIGICLLVLPLCSTAQQKKIALKADNWTFPEGTVQFKEVDARPVMQIDSAPGKVVLKSLDFTDGTIEFDYAPMDDVFSFIYFRYKSSDECESMYFRNQRAGNLSAGDALQYAPHIKGIGFWDMLFDYQTFARFKKNDWNHIKMVIAGKQMRVYLNNETTPTLGIPQLEADVLHGTLAFEGRAAIADLMIKPGITENLDRLPGVDLTAHDPAYLRNWEVSTPINTPPKVDFSSDWLPAKDATWTPITAERRGLVNLTRQFPMSKARRFVWLKTTVQAKTAGTKKMQLGFSDDVWVYVNGRLLYVDKNGYTGPIRKEPAGRCSIENTSFAVPLKEGDNELMIGVAADFFGWGIIARLASVGGN